MIVCLQARPCQEDHLWNQLQYGISRTTALKANPSCLFQRWMPCECADGLAVGASSLSPDRELTGLIALAMVLHKMPAAIGLTSYLRGRSWPLQDALKALLIFAAASPLVALACAAILVSFPGVSSSPEVGCNRSPAGMSDPLLLPCRACLAWHLCNAQRFVDMLT